MFKVVWRRFVVCGQGLSNIPKMYFRTRSNNDTEQTTFTRFEIADCSDKATYLYFSRLLFVFLGSFKPHRQKPKTKRGNC